MFTFEFSKKQSRLMGKLWRLISSTYLVSLYENNISKWGENFILSSRLHLQGVGTKIMQMFLNYENQRKSLYGVEESSTTSW
jgi:hypothetical protein